MSRQTSACEQALNYMRIYSCLNRKTYMSAQQILDALHVMGFRSISLLTVQRALKTMRENSGFNIDWTDRSKPYSYRISEERPFEWMKFTPEECLMLRLVRDDISQRMPSSLVYALEPLFAVANETLAEAQTGASRSRKWIDKVASIPNTLPFETAPVGFRVQRDVTEALYSDLMLSVKYRNIEGVETEKTVSPLGLVQQDNRLYLVCVYEGHEDIRHLAMHRIITAEKLEGRPAVRPEGFKLKEYVGSVAFNYTDAPLERIKLEIVMTSRYMVQVLRETPFSSKHSKGQKIKDLGDGRWCLTVETDDSFLLDAWIRTWEKAAGFESVKKTKVEKPVKAKSKAAK